MSKSWPDDMAKWKEGILCGDVVSDIAAFFFLLMDNLELQKYSERWLKLRWLQIDADSRKLRGQIRKCEKQQIKSRYQLEFQCSSFVTRVLDCSFYFRVDLM